MRAKIYQLVIIFFYIAAILQAQQSVHLTDKLNHQIYPNEISSINILNENSSQLTKKVFGYLPYWELYDTALTLRYDLLSHIAVFDFVLQNDGTISVPPEWPTGWNTIINSAQLNGVKLIMTISNLSLTDTDSLLISNLINDQSVKNIFFADVKSIIEENNFDGLNLDFENPKLSERGDLMNNFVNELRDSLDTWFTGKELSFATPAVNWGNRWKLKELSEICDYLFIMAYDYHGSWSTNAGPVAPLSGNNQYNIWNYHTTIENDYAEVDRSKIILGVPYYGAEWLTDSFNPYADVIPDYEPNTNWVQHIDYEDAYFIFNDAPSISFDGISQTTYRMGPRGDQFNLVWIDTTPSLGLKYDFAIEQNLGGIGMWSLGKDGSHPELWNLIESKFTDTTLAVEDEILENDFILYQNYPNPFNPTTTIKFSIASGAKQSVFTTLKIYNMLGQEVRTLVNQKMQAGYHEINFDGSSLSSGVYFYKINLGNEYISTKKMLLIK